jgi:trehalose/maltose hydrolase-like predicted phosphorylase
MQATHSTRFASISSAPSQSLFSASLSNTRANSLSNARTNALTNTRTNAHYTLRSASRSNTHATANATYSSPRTVLCSNTSNPTIKGDLCAVAIWAAIVPCFMWLGNAMGL